MKTLLCATVLAYAVSAYGEDWYESWYDKMLDPLLRNLRQTKSWRYTLNDQKRELCEPRQNTSDAACWEDRSPFQHSVVLDTGNHLGRVLYLDCMAQSSEADEFIYHEALVQSAMIAHPDPQRVLIAGGGEGGTAREVLKHISVKKVVMVDLDSSLVKLSEKYLPYWNGIKEDPRFTLIEGDAVAWMNQTSERFDVIIFDFPDFIKGTEFLYQKPVLQLAKNRLADNRGVVSTHSGGNICTDPKSMNCRYAPILLNTYREVFGEAILFMAPMPLWQILHGFIVGTAQPSLHQAASTIDKRMAGSLLQPLRFYSSAMHTKMSTLPKDYAAFVRSETEVMDEAIGEKAPISIPSMWKTCSCDQTKCVEMQEEDERADGVKSSEDDEDEEDEDEEADEGAEGEKQDL